ncbi:UNVERIFIED_CONTAM: hypothetical protein NCL1_27011 [Trichonephila clavipes]
MDISVLCVIGLPYTKRNQTLLGMDFLRKASIVLNLRNRNWFFGDNYRRFYDLVKEVVTQEVQSHQILNRTPTYCSMKKLNVS